jgi:voltage-gated potassium channel Kch
VTVAGTLLSTAAGVGLIGLVGRDAFDALFHAEGRGVFSRQITRAVWQVFRRAGTRHVRLSLAGPVAFVTVIATWAGLLVLGWALVFWPHMPGSFRFDPDVEAAGSDLVHALNVSLVTLTTLGFGDITPTSEALRLILPLEALLGFGLLSASISWLVSIYPALSRRRSLAYEISLLRAAEAEGDLSLDALPPDAAERILAELTSRLVAVERDLVHFPISYYFSAGDPRFSLPVAAPYLLEIARRGMNEAQPMIVRFRARLLMQAIDDLAKTTAAQFHGSGATTPEELLRGYARDHLVHER